MNLSVRVHEVFKNLARHLNILLVAELDDPVSIRRWKISLVLVDLDARLKQLAVGLGVKLGGVDIGLLADHLVGARGGRPQVDPV